MSRKQLWEIELQMVSAISFGWVADFGKPLPLFNARPNRFILTNGKHPWFKYRLIKLDLVTVGKFCFNFSRVLDGVVDCVSVKPSARALKLMLA